MKHRTSPIAFYENEWLVRSLTTSDDFYQAYRLRYQVFAGQLKWIPTNQDSFDCDEYDGTAHSVGLFDSSGKLCGAFRMIKSPDTFMLEREFRPCLDRSVIIIKDQYSAEITRLALSPDLQKSKHSIELMHVLFKGVYQWSVRNKLTRLYMVVEPKLFRLLRGLQFPCAALSKPVAILPAKAKSIAVVLDWETFHLVVPSVRLKYYQWFNTLDGSRAFTPTMVGKS